jgi:hypothetical protein
VPDWEEETVSKIATAVDEEREERWARMKREHIDPAMERWRAGDADYFAEQALLSAHYGSRTADVYALLALALRR